MQVKCLDKPGMTGFDSFATHKVAVAENEVTVDVFDSITKVPGQWDLLVEDKDCFLSRKFLRMMEDHPVAGIQPYYLLFTISEQPVGVAYLQQLKFNFRQAFQQAHKGDSGQTKGEPFRRRVFRWASGRIKGRPLICGSVFLTGEHGFWFAPQALLDEEQQYSIVVAGMEKLRRGISSRPRVHIVKDLHAARQTVEQYYSDHGFVRLPWLQPSMEMVLPEEWKSFEHYLAAMLSKYRTRAKRAAKKAAPLSKREICKEELEELSPRLDELYREVANGVEFNVATLPKNYFLLMKKLFPDRFTIFGYFLDQQLLGFCTTLMNEDEMEAHFLGFDHGANRKYQLYLNMLYDIVKTGIEGNAARIHFGRTAHEIKSSVGAVPVVYHSYIRHTNRFLNAVSGKVLKNLLEEMEWEQRHPFK